VAAGDSETARRAAHTLKSNAATFGATGLAELCAELEAGARGGDLADGAQAMQRIDVSFAAVEAELAAVGTQLAEA
jgi:HPt (histidine-containing phosphotransfer) domain-containing protein